jgi:Tfp pilus assembly protein PilN
MGASSRTAEPDYTRVGADELAWRELIHDRLRSLRNGMLALGALVVVALGLALWGLLTAQTARDERATVSVTRARSLERRIDRLEAQVAHAPSAADVARIEGRLQAVEATAGQAQQTSAALDDRLQRLEQRVDDSATSTPTPTPTH